MPYPPEKIQVPSILKNPESPTIHPESGNIE
jgi:hypothetical protein